MSIEGQKYDTLIEDCCVTNDYGVKFEGPSQKVEDNWKHRSDGMRCRSCMWWVEKNGPGSTLGRCRRHAPTLGGWPAVFNSDWCGDHKLR